MFGVKSLVKQADNYGKDDTLSIGIQINLFVVKCAWSDH